MQQNTKQVNFNKMICFEPRKVGTKCSMSVNYKGFVYVSKAIIEYFLNEYGSLYVDFRHSEDYRVLAIKVGEHNTFKLPKGGKFKYKELRNAIQDRGYKMPAIYMFEKYEKEKMWVGTLQEVAAAPLD